MPDITVDQVAHTKALIAEMVENLKLGIAPKDIREIDQQGLHSTHFTCYEPAERGRACIRIGEGKKAEYIQGEYLVYWDGTGVFYASCWKWLPGNAKHYGKNYCMVKFFAFGCQHDYQQTRNLGNCLNEFQCSKCKRINVVDSSD